MKKVIISLVIVVISGLLIMAFVKRSVKSDYQQLVMRYDQALDLKSADALEKSLDELDKLIAMTIGIIATKTWSSSEVSFFEDTLNQRLTKLYEKFCSESNDKKMILRGHPINVGQLQLATYQTILKNIEGQKSKGNVNQNLFQYPRLKPPALAGQLSATTLQADSDAL